VQSCGQLLKEVCSLPTLLRYLREQLYLQLGDLLEEVLRMRQLQVRHVRLRDEESMPTSHLSFQQVQLLLR
jgi:hypothetical protein